MQKFTKNQANAKQHIESDFSYLKIIHTLHPHYLQKILGHILKNKQKGQPVFTHEITRLIIMKMKMKIKNKSNR